ncbi:hypothetical protein TSAR_013102 [Trichomalopsis sarcophagae]|uniref:Uncharacterized protein n=1 Tax=Trichomalopsis sarcophagae TaxID=543379 RepID=A0A232F037_9HYME|nr:hypothetical protein TSAR_013102 [Trichomalopsis sarcophagae]
MFMIKSCPTKQMPTAQTNVTQIIQVRAQAIKRDTKGRNRTSTTAASSLILTTPNSEVAKKTKKTYDFMCR